MSNYLLLRSNKQSGPYTLDQIRTIGLKAYDLIWIEGRSAAWRYPGEVEEFKSFAPIVEEQPYDRFYKRSSPKTQASTTDTKIQSTEKETLSFASFENIIPYGGDTQKSTIYAVAPAPEKSSASSREPLHPTATVEGAVLTGMEIDEPIKEKKKISISTPAPLVPNMDKVNLEEKFSRPLDEIKKQYVEQMLNRKGEPLKFRQLAIIAAMVFGLILLFAGGIFVGLSINKRGINSSTKDLAKEEPGVVTQQAEYHPHPIPVSVPISEQPLAKSSPVNDDLSEFLNDSEKKQLKELERKKPIPVKERVLAPSIIQKNKPAADSASPSSAVESRQSTHRTDALVAREAIKNNIADYVILSTNKYNVGTFGGISQLQITVSNRSLYPLDLVVAELQYIQTNKKVYKTENLYFRNVGAGSTLIQDAPKSTRGVKVQYRITVINSKELGLAFSGI
jgi:hypothetical protein